MDKTEKLMEECAFLFLLCLPCLFWVSYIGFLTLVVLFIKRRSKFTLNYFTIALIGALLLSAIFSPYPSFSLGAFVTFLCYILAYLLFASIKVSGKKLLNAILIAGTVLTLIAVIQYLTDFTLNFAHGIVQLRFTARSATLGNPNHLANYLVMTIPFAFSSLLSNPVRNLFLNGTNGRNLPPRPRTAWRGGQADYVLIILLLLAFFSLWISQSIIGIIATFIAIVGILWFKNKWLSLSLLVIGIVTGGLTYKKISSFTSVGSSQARLYTWEEVVPRIVKDYPITGCGIGVYKKVFPKYTVQNKGLDAHAHSIYLNYLAETGILGLSAFLLFLGMFFYQAIKYLRKSFNWFVLGGCFSIIGLLICGTVETCISRFQTGLFFFSILGFISKITRS